MRPKPAIESLRAQIEKVEGRSRRTRSVLPFGIAELDARLPGEGLARGALHEVAGGGNGAVDGAAAALFSAGIAARTKGKVLWCITRPDLFAPALAQAGLSPDRVIYVEAGDEATVLACMEEGLRHGGSIAIALRRWRRQMEATDFGQPTAAMTRWRVSALPSQALPVPGVGRHRWLVELIRARAGESADFELEACDDTGRLVLIGREGNRRVVFAADAAAQAAGLRVGMPVTKAQVLVPGLIVEDADPQADAEALERLAEWALRFSPVVAADPPGGIVIETTGADSSPRGRGGNARRPDRPLHHVRHRRPCGRRR